MGWYKWLNHISSVASTASQLDAMNRIGGVMVSLLASSAVDRGFDPRSGQTKDYKVGIWLVGSESE
jgi:hypothetical protein